MTCASSAITSTDTVNKNYKYAKDKTFVRECVKVMKVRHEIYVDEQIKREKEKEKNQNNTRLTKMTQNIRNIHAMDSNTFIMNAQSLSRCPGHKNGDASRLAKAVCKVRKRNNPSDQEGKAKTTMSKEYQPNKKSKNKILVHKVH